MKSRYFLFLSAAVGAGAVLSSYWKPARNQAARPSPGTHPHETTQPRPPKPQSPPTVREFNDQQGLSGQEIYEKVMAEMEAKGGGLQMWKDDMQRVTQEAQQIKTVKLTPELATYLDKVHIALRKGGGLFDGPGVKLLSILDAKRAAVIDAKGSSLPYYTIPSKAVLHKNVVYFAPGSPDKNGLGQDVTVPTDFSQGFALKLDEENKIRRYVWDFHLKPPADGIIGIATETE